MAEWQDQLNTILSDPDAMAQIASLAQSLSGQQQSPPQAETPPAQNTEKNTQPDEAAFDPSAVLSGLGGLDPKLLQRFAPLLQEINRPKSGNTASLLMSLRPFLSEKRRGKVERAAQLARIIHLGKVFLTQGQEEQHRV